MCSGFIVWRFLEHDAFIVHLQGVLGAVCSATHHSICGVQYTLWEFEVKQISLFMVALCFKETGRQVLSQR